MASTDWELFLQDVTWFDQSDVIAVGRSQSESFRPTHSLRSEFPQLTKLLSHATITPIRTKDAELQLFAWPAEGGRMGWLCEQPLRLPPHIPLHPDHFELLQEWGGLTERFGEPTSWLLNLNWAIVEAQCSLGISPSWEGFFRDKCRRLGFEPAIRPAEYVAFAQEANSNLTLYHQQTGELVLFATDHAFKHVVPFPSCPDYTFYRIRGCATVRDWVESVATQWLRYVV